MRKRFRGETVLHDEDVRFKITSVAGIKRRKVVRRFPGSPASSPEARRILAAVLPGRALKTFY